MEQTAFCGKTKKI